MTVAALSRRSLLLLPALLAACGPDEPATYEPLRYDFLPPIPLNVLTLEVEQRFRPSGIPPDATADAPVKPIAALTSMAQDRLRPFGAKGRAVLAIQDATLTRRGDTINGSLAVMLNIYREAADRAAWVEARVVRREAGGSGSTRYNLYQVVRSMMDQMNVELEFQIRRHLKDWITEPTAAPTPVQQAPLAVPGRT
jgi:hypothetical protein